MDIPIIFFISAAVMIFADMINMTNMYRKFLFLTLCVSAALISALRNGSGFDYSSYVNIFDAVPNLIDLINDYELLYVEPLRFVENGFLLVIATVKMFFDDVVVLFAIVSFATLSFYYKAIPRLNRYVFASFFLYISMIFLFKEMGQIRHGLALALALYSVLYLVNKKYREFILINLIAVCFHKAVLGIFFLLAVKGHTWSKRESLVSIAVATVFLLFDPAKKIINYALFFGEDSRLYYVMNNDSLLGEVSVEKLVVPFLIVIMMIFAKGRMRECTDIYNVEMSMMIFGLLTLTFFHSYKELAQRLSSVYLIAEIIILPQLTIGVSKNYLLKYLGCIVTCIIGVIYIIHTLEEYGA